MINIVTWCDSETDRTGQGHGSRNSKGSFKVFINSISFVQKIYDQTLSYEFLWFKHNPLNSLLYSQPACIHLCMFHSLITPSMHEEYFADFRMATKPRIIDRMNGKHRSRQAGNDACFTQSMHVIFMSFIVFNSSHPIMHIQNTTISHLLYCHYLPACLPPFIPVYTKNAHECRP